MRALNLVLTVLFQNLRALGRSAIAVRAREFQVEACAGRMKSKAWRRVR
jgi:hypothetical protein